MNVEQVNSRPARWYTLLGLLLVPVLVAGGFLLAGVNSDGRLHTVQAAVVNLDEPVTIDDQYTPLGRQLTANLVDSDRQQNLTWVLESEENARAGLETGTYAAMVVIPENFSAAATSFSKDADEAEQATIQVYTSPVAGVADATLGKLVANEAAAMLNQTLTESYLKQIYIGFNDMGDQFVTMSDGASDLADGAEKLADGIDAAADGSQKLYSGASQLADGLGQMKAKTAGMPKAIRKLANGTGDLAKGVKQYVGGVNQLVDQTLASAEQLPQLAAALKASANGAGDLAGGLQQASQGLKSTIAAASAGVLPCPSDLSESECSAYQRGAKDTAGNFEPGISQAAQGAAGLSTGLTTIADRVSAMVPGSEAEAQLAQLKAAGKQLTAGTAELAKGTDKLADQMPQLVDGIAQSADGAGQLAAGVDQLGAGLIDAASGSGKLADGMREMADGIADGLDKLPSYSKSDRENLATVVASPIDTGDLQGLANANVGWISLVLVLALWLGALATYSVVKAIGTGLLSSSEPTALLIARALWPGLAVVGAQALVVSALGQLGLDLSPQKWLAVTGMLLLAGVTFVVINHALVAWFGGIGRLVAVLFAVLTTAAALIGAAPGVFAALRPFSPLTPALDAIRAIITESSGAATSSLTLVGWLLIALIASSVAVARRRTTTLAAVVAAG